MFLHHVYTVFTFFKFTSGNSADTAAALEVTSPWSIPQIGYEVLNTDLIQEYSNLSSVVPDSGMEKYSSLLHLSYVTLLKRRLCVIVLPKDCLPDTRLDKLLRNDRVNPCLI